MRVLSIVLIICLFQFCTGKSAKVDEPADADTTNYFQVPEYISSQLAEINNTPYFIYKVVTEDTKRDSLPINNTQTAELAKQFMDVDLNDPALKNLYTENVFFDESTKNFTINYSTNNKNVRVQNLDVLLKEDGKTVKRIFIRKFFNYGDSSAIEQLSWKPNESFQVNRMVQQAGKPEISRQTLVVWNARENNL